MKKYPAVTKRQSVRKESIELWKVRLPANSFVGINESELKKANPPKGGDAKLPVYG
jgi:hypothetical protein